MLLEDLGFFAKWLRAPRRIGGVIPSWEPLARAMAAEVDPARPGAVVELGAGTGAVTRALLEAGVEPPRLLLVERDAALHAVLLRRFPGVSAILGDALDIGDLLAGTRVAGVAAVVSSLPLLAMPQGARAAILGRSFGAMGEGGRFVQYTYGPASPVADWRLRRLGLEGRVAERVWLNVPPATVWRFTRLSARARS